MPALLRRDKTCCWWAGGQALRAASREGANKRPAARARSRAHGAPGVGATGGWGAGTGTPALPALPVWVLEAAAPGEAHVYGEAGAAAGQRAELVGALIFLRLICAFDYMICRAFLEPC